MTSLEGWGSAIELRPRARRTIPPGEHRQRTRTKGYAPNHDGRRAVRPARLPARGQGIAPRATTGRRVAARGAVGYGTIHRDVAQLG
jgi:hypothetical protein